MSAGEQQSAAERKAAAEVERKAAAAAEAERKAAEEAAKKEEPSGDQLRNADVADRRVPESYLITNARALFGVRPSYLAGALATSARVNSSPDEVRELLKEYEGHTVEPLAGTPQAEEE